MREGGETPVGGVLNVTLPRLLEGYVTVVTFRLNRGGDSLGPQQLRQLRDVGRGARALHSHSSVRGSTARFGCVKTGVRL